MARVKGMALFTLVAMFDGVVAQQMPACGERCLSSGLAGSSCSATDTLCICADDTLQTNITTCITMSCTVKESLTSQNASNTMCDVPPRDITSVTPMITSVFMSLAIAATLMRTLQFCKQFGPEDIFAIFALLTAVPMGALEYPMSRDGYGRDIWTVEFDQITRILKFTWLLEILYFICMPSIKMAFLCLYLRIFPKEGLRKAVYFLMGVNLLYFLGFFVSTAFNCLPVSYIWTKWTGETEGSCLNFNALALIAAVINILLDLAVIGLPLREIAKLSLSWTKKLLLLSMFGMGFFVTIVSIIRLRVVITFATTTNATYDTVPTSYWSIIEAFSGIICVNMPAIRRFYKKVVHLCKGTPDTEPYLYPSDTPVRVSKRKPIELSILKTVDMSVRTETAPCESSDREQLMDMDMQQRENR